VESEYTCYDIISVNMVEIHPEITCPGCFGVALKLQRAAVKARDLSIESIEKVDESEFGFAGLAALVHKVLE